RGRERLGAFGMWVPDMPWLHLMDVTLAGLLSQCTRDVATVGGKCHRQRREVPKPRRLAQARRDADAVRGLAGWYARHRAAGKGESPCGLDPKTIGSRP